MRRVLCGFRGSTNLLCCTVEAVLALEITFPLIKGRREVKRGKEREEGRRGFPGIDAS